MPGFKAMHLNLIWLDTPQSLMEADWIRWLFQDFEIAEHVAPKMDLFKDKSIYVLSSNSHLLARVPRSFLKGIEGLSGKGLFHLSDESFSGGYEVYTAFDFVLRNYYSKLFDNAGIKTLPLGFTDNPANRPCCEVAADRKFLWSFAGIKTAARLDMFDNLKMLKPHKCFLFDIRKRQKPTLDRPAFMALLSDAVFSPCPMGNVVLESFRVYESLEMGCIPIVERRRWMPYFDRLMPGHPLPTFSSWRRARQLVEAVSKDKSALTAYQQSIAKWWQSYKMEIRNEVASFVSLGLEGAFRSQLRHWHCRKGVYHQVWRVVELLKHASRASLQERISITIRRNTGHLWSPPRGARH
jgi:hypothetical protein